MPKLTRILTRALRSLIVCAAMLFYGSVSSAAESDFGAADMQQVVNQYCLACHNDTLPRLTFPYNPLTSIALPKTLMRWNGW